MTPRARRPKARRRSARAPAVAAPASPPPIASDLARHELILAELQAEFGERVYLLSRLVEPELELAGDPTVHVFIPDLHIVPHEDIRVWPGRVLTPSRAEPLEALLRALARLKEAESAQGRRMEVWQLGDLIDLWRVGDTPDLPLRERLDRTLEDWGVLERLEPGGVLGARRLFGNHDEALRTDPDFLDHSHVPEDPGHTASNDMLVAHGHQFDPVEDLPEWIKASFMRGLTQRVERYTQDIILRHSPHWNPVPDYSFTPPRRPPPDEREKFVSPDLKPDEPVPLSSDRWNVQQIRLIYRPDADPLETAGSHGLQWQDSAHPKLWDRSKLRAQQAAAAGYSVSLVVVAHTHNPRILLGTQPGGQRVALMDCGAWVGPRFLSPHIAGGPVHNTTIGVRVGADLRLYQLGADRYKWPD